MLGKREPEIYGNYSLDEINRELLDFAREVSDNIEVDFFQSNHEGEIIDKIQTASINYSGIILNPAAYTHTSVAISDAIKCSEIKVVEVHLSNISAREDFRHVSYCAKNCVGQISGFGKDSYKLALLGLFYKC